MKRKKSANGTRKMSADAYAGFLRLLLTPADRIPAPSAELDAYLRHLEATEPLSEETRRAIGLEVDRAA